MTRHVLVAAVAVWVAAGAVPRTQTPSAGDLVTLDVSVSDKSGPITDLKAEEFQIQDDGKKVEIKSVVSVTADGMTKQTGRNIAIILDDSSAVPPTGTGALQTIANLFVSGTGPGDSVSVMPLHGTFDAQSTQQLALSRIASFTAAARPFVMDQSPEEMLKLMTSLSRKWQETGAGRRQAIVCVGSQVICAVPERATTAQGDQYPNWIDVVHEMGRAHAVAYAAIPAPIHIPEGFVTDLTGGASFSANSNFTPAVETVMRDLSRYYMVTYVEPKSSKKIRTMSVKVARKNVTVQTRTRR